MSELQPCQAARERIVRTLAHVTAPTLARDGGIILRPADKSPYDVYLVYLDGERVKRIVARHRHAGEALAQPPAAGKAMMNAWTLQAKTYGWPWQLGYNPQGHLMSWSSHDEETQVRVFWQNNGDSGPRVFTEWK